MSEAAPSITTWLERLRHSDAEAAQRLWERFFERMAAVARRRLRDVGRRAADEEDAALSAFADFARAVKAGRFPDLRDRDELWGVLFTLTVRKARGQVRHEQQKRRGGGQVDGVLPADLAGDELPPDEIAALQDELAWLLGQLASDEVRRVALLRLEGFGNDEIAQQTGCSRATVERRARLVRETWRWLMEREEKSPPS
jgi:DNA-directed RNA polymerase specialized sigma24 family protein